MLCAEFFQEITQDIHLIPVGFRGGLNLLGCFQSVSLPNQTAPHCPGQDSRHFGPQLFWKLLVLPLEWYRDGKRHQPYPSPDSVVRSFYDGLVVCRQEQLELRVELKKLAI